VPAIRERTVAHLFNIHHELATKVAAGLGFKKLPALACCASGTASRRLSSSRSSSRAGADCFGGGAAGTFLDVAWRRMHTSFKTL
jgi:hypothetical protein